MPTPGKERHPCRHPKSFPFAGGLFMWCPDCGALRRMKQVTDGNVCEPAWKGWVRPNGWTAAVELWNKFENERTDRGGRYIIVRHPSESKAHDSR